MKIRWLDPEKIMEELRGCFPSGHDLNLYCGAAEGLFRVLALYLAELRGIRDALNDTQDTRTTPEPPAASPPRTSNRGLRQFRR